MDTTRPAEAPETESGRADIAAQRTRLGELRARLHAVDAAHDTRHVPGEADATSPALLPRLPDETSTRKDRDMLHKIGLTTIVVALAAALAGSVATAGGAAPKPGFVPGTWVGKGVIKGYVVDGPMATHWDGGMSFTIKVDKKLRVTGSGKWALNMLGSEDAPSSYGVDATMNGSAALGFSGGATRPAFSGTQHISGEIRSAGMSRPISFDRSVKGRLFITKATKCKVVGRSPIQSGVTLTWTAVLKGGGKCNA